MINNSEVKVVQKYLFELYELAKERAAMRRKMEQKEAALRSILSLHDEDEVQPYLEQLELNIHSEGFTDAVRRVLRTTEDGLAATDVRDKLPDAGFSLDGYTNPLASIHTILKRLAKTPDVESATGKDGVVRYRWAHPRSRVTRAYVPRGSLVEQFFAEADAKKRKKP
jgi:hypothetical protein